MTGPPVLSEVVDLGIPDLGDATEIGRGGFAVVYRAQEHTTNRIVAVKVLHTDLSEADRRRFEREAAALGHLSEHPGIVTLYRAGFTGAGQPYMVMPYMSRGSLRERLSSGTTLAAPEVAAIARQLVGALSAAHGAGVLHCDIKPDNVLISDLGGPQLADFGIARLADATMSQTSVAFSPSYVAPEVVSGHAPTPASDVYSLGATLHALLAGRAPFTTGDDNVLTVLARVASEPPADLLPMGTPRWLADLVGEMMAKDPATRPGLTEVESRLANIETAETVAAVVSQPRTAETVRTHRRARLGVAAVAVIAVGIVGAVLVLGGRESDDPIDGTAADGASDATTETTSEETTDDVGTEDPATSTAAAATDRGSVLVVNGSGQPEMGAAVVERLTELDYEAEEVTAPRMEASRIFYRDGFADDAAVLAERVEAPAGVAVSLDGDNPPPLGATAAEAAREYDLIIVLGTDDIIGG